MNKGFRVAILFVSALVLIGQLAIPARANAPQQNRSTSANASDWVRQTPIPTTESLGAIWGSDSNNIFVVGNAGVILHYDGASWQSMVTGTAANLGGGLGKFWK